MRVNIDSFNEALDGSIYYDNLCVEWREDFQSMLFKENSLMGER